MSPITLTHTELSELTGYRQATKQLAELHRQGFWRARRGPLGGVILEREHYEAVTRGTATATPSTGPKLRRVAHLASGLQAA